MKLYCNSIADVVKSIEGKKFLAECKPQKNFNLSKIKPISSIDGDIVSYSIKNNARLVDSTPVEDIFEKMSFEKPSVPSDSLRRHELHKWSDTKYPLYANYSNDELPLSPTIYSKIAHSSKMKNTYYPETDLNYDSQIILKHIDFREQIVPSSFDVKLHVDKDTLNSYADEATHMWENGILTNDIIKLIDKSVLKGGGKVPTRPNIDLFRFLSKYPEARKFITYTSSDGAEHIDMNAMLYYDTFTKYLGDTKIAQKIIDDCKLQDGFVNKDLCEIAFLTRRKTAHGITENRPSAYLYCDKNIPWRNCDSELLKKLKNGNKLQSTKFELTKKLLKDYSQPVDYILKNIDDFEKAYNLINEVDDIVVQKYKGQYKNERNNIHKELMSLFETYMTGDKSKDDFEKRINLTNYLLRQNIKISKILTFFQAMK